MVLDETPGKGYLIRNVRLEFGPGSKGDHARAGDDSRRQGAVPRADQPEPGGLGTVAASARIHLLRDMPATTAWMMPLLWRSSIPITTSLRLPRRAWAAGLVLDYLETLPQVDMKHVGMFGYSRDGKMATIATAHR